MSLTLAVWGVDHPHGGGHIKALSGLVEVEALLVWDPDPDKAEAVCGPLDKAVLVDDIEERIEARSVDGVVMLLNTRDAGPATLRAVEAGLYVYGDKPGARTAGEMAAIVDASVRTGGQFCPCYPWRIDPVITEFKRLIDGGVLGETWSFDATWLTSQVALRGPSSWLFHHGVSGGGILSWLGCHWLDLLMFLLGPAASVTAKLATRCGEDIDVEDTASLVMQLRSGAIGTLRAGYTHKPFTGYDDNDLCMSFEGSLGSIYWAPKSERGYRLRTGHPDYAGASARWVKVDPTPSPDQGYSTAFLRAFLDALKSRTAPPATAEDALAVIRVIEAAQKSSRDGVHVAV